LRARVLDIEPTLRAHSLELRKGEPFAQIVGLDGTVLSSSSTLDPKRPLLTPAELRRASKPEIRVDRAVPGLDNPGRLLARPEPFRQGHVVVVVGTSLETGQLAHHRVIEAMLIAAPLLVLLLGVGV